MVVTERSPIWGMWSAMDTLPILLSCLPQDDFDFPTRNGDWVDTTDIPYVMVANDNVRTKDRLSARCGTLLRRLIGLHSLR
jgi:hypothetical protein